MQRHRTFTKRTAVLTRPSELWRHVGEPIHLLYWDILRQCSSVWFDQSHFNLILISFYSHSIIWQLILFFHVWTFLNLEYPGMPVQFAANQGPSQTGLFKNPRTFLIVFSGFRLIGYDLIRVSPGGHYTWNSPEPVKKTNYIIIYYYRRWPLYLGLSVFWCLDPGTICRFPGTICKVPGTIWKNMRYIEGS